MNNKKTTNNNNSSNINNKNSINNINTIINTNDDDDDDNDHDNDLSLGYSTINNRPSRSNTRTSTSTAGCISTKTQSSQEEPLLHDEIVVRSLPSSSVREVKIPYYFDTSSEDEEQVVSRLRKIADDDGLEPVPCHETFSVSFRPVLTLLQIFGFFPAPLQHPSWRNFTFRLYQRCFLMFLFVFYFLVNSALFAYNMVNMHLSRHEMGGWHAQTITTIITGLLPLQNVINFFVFALRVPQHRKMLRDMDYLVSTKCYTTQPRWNVVMILGVALAFALPLAAHICHHVFVIGMVYDPIGLSAFILVPLLRVWQFLPMLYFIMLGSHIKHWFDQLQEFLCLRKSNCLSANNSSPLSQTYPFYIVLTGVVKRYGRTMDMFVVMCIGFSTFTLCLTIYFMTQVESLLVDTTEFNITLQDQWLYQLNSYFEFSWSGWQIAFSAILMLIICNVGWSINEQARQFQGTVLSMNTMTSDDRFQVMRFTIKINTQISWGMTVWRAFLIERSLLFTIISTILAYALILNQLRAHTSSNDPDCPEIDLLGANSTTFTPLQGITAGLGSNS